MSGQEWTRAYTSAPKKKTALEVEPAKPLFLNQKMVAGVRFELTTFGLYCKLKVTL